MKKLRKLRLNDEQKLSQKEQDMVLAGWQGPCYCKNVGDCHVEWQLGTEWDPEWKGAIDSGMDLIGDIIGLYYNHNLLLVTKTYWDTTKTASCIFRYKYVNEYRKMKLTGISPFKHVVYDTWKTDL